MGESNLKMSDNLKNMREKETMSDFRVAGDLETNNSEKKEESIQDYLDSIVEESYRFKEGYLVLEAGSVAISLNKLNKMIEDGYTITKAESLGPSGLVAVEFEKAITKKNYHI